MSCTKFQQLILYFIYARIYLKYIRTSYISITYKIKYYFFSHLYAKKTLFSCNFTEIHFLVLVRTHKIHTLFSHKTTPLTPHKFIIPLQFLLRV